MSMTNDELAQAIDAAERMLRESAPIHPRHAPLLEHLKALLAEQRRRATTPALQVGPIAPLLVQPPVVVPQPTWVPGSTGNPPWKPPFEVTCGTQ